MALLVSSKLEKEDVYNQKHSNSYSPGFWEEKQNYTQCSLFKRVKCNDFASIYRTPGSLELPPLLVRVMTRYVRGGGG